MARRVLTDGEQLKRLPDLAYLFLFHWDYRLREAALRRISSGLPSPFLFMAVVFRLNDPMPRIRPVALACAERCFPQTAPDVVADAASAVLLPQGGWRQGVSEPAVVGAAFARHDVGTRLAEQLVVARTGPAPRLFRAAMRYDALDAHLPRLAAEAVQPTLRAAAVRAVGAMRATWPDGVSWTWTDRSLGQRVRAVRVGSRPITHPLPREAVLLTATHDRSPFVRAAALDALTREDAGGEQVRAVASRLAADPSRAVRDRAAFVLARVPR